MNTYTNYNSISSTQINSILLSLNAKNEIISEFSRLKGKFLAISNVTLYEYHQFLSFSRKQTSTVRASRERRRLIAGSITGCNFISSPVGGRNDGEWWIDEIERASRVQANGFPCTATRVWIRPWNDFTRGEGDVGRPDEPPGRMAV